MMQTDFDMPGLNISGEKLDKVSGEKEEREEQVWRDGHMLFTFEKGSGENELPTDIDIDTIFLDYNSSDSSLLENEKPQTQEVVLVLPGIGMDLEVNRNFLESLAKTGRRVVSLSVPGCGDSGDPSNEWRRSDKEDSKGWKDDFSNYSALLNRLIEELKTQGKIGKDEKLRVVGHSLGGIMAAEFTANNLDKVSVLDLISPGGYKKEEIKPTHIYPKTTAEFILKQGKEVFDRVKQVGMKEVPDIIRRMWLNNFARKDSKMNYDTLDKSDVGFLPRMLQRLWEAEVVLHGGLEKYMQQISDKIPVKVLVGENDNLFPSSDYIPIVTRLQLNGGDVNMKEIPDSGHYGLVLKSKEFVSAL